MMSECTAKNLRLASYLLGGMSLLFGLAFSLQIVTAVLRRYRVNNWPSTNAFVQGVELKGQTYVDKKITTYELSIRYSYVIAGKQYQAESYFWDLSDVEAHRLSSELTNKKAEKTPIVCHVDPDNADHVFLYQARDLDFYESHTIPPLIFFGVAIALISTVRVLTKRKPVTQPYPIKQVISDVPTRATSTLLRPPAEITGIKTVDMGFDLLGILLGFFSKMRRMWWLIGLAAFMLWYLLYDHLFAIWFPGKRDVTHVTIMSACMTLAISVLFVLPYWFRELKLLRRADNPVFADGERTAVHGALVSEEASAITTPFTKRSCLYYEYRIFHTPYNQTHSITDFAGHSKQVSLLVESAAGKVRLLDYVSPTESFTGDTDEPQIASMIDPFLKETVFERTWEAYIASTNGGNFCREDASLGLERQELDEAYFPVGAEVCIIGQWSAAEAGLKSIGSAQKSYRITSGTPKQACRPIVKRIGTGIFIAVMLAALVNFFALIIFAT